MSDAEELRATAYRQLRRTQLANRRAMAGELRGSQLARVDLADAWNPLIEASTPIPDVESIEDELEGEHFMSEERI